MDERDVKNYLKGHFYAYQKINALECEKLSSGIEAARINEIEKEISELKAEQDRIRQAIASMHDNNLETVLIYRYVLYFTEEKTAEKMHYATRTVQEKTKKAIAKLKSCIEMC